MDLGQRLDTTGSRLLVTGAAGMIGACVLRNLLRMGRQAIGTDSVAQVGLEQLDLTDLRALDELVRRRSITAIIHCGGVSGPQLHVQDPRGLLEINVSGTVNVAEVARRHHLSRVVFASSAVVCTGQPAATVYAASKAMSELALSAYGNAHGLDAIAIRLSWVFGPGRRTDCVLSRMITDALSWRKTVIRPAENYMRQLLYVEDAAAALITALDAPFAARPAYTVTGGTYLAMKDVAATVRSILGNADIELPVRASHAADLSAPSEPFDISPIRDELGFVPNWSLEDGLRDYVAWCRAGRPDRLPHPDGRPGARPPHSTTPSPRSEKE